MLDSIIFVVGCNKAVILKITNKSFKTKMHDFRINTSLHGYSIETYNN